MRCADFTARWNELLDRRERVEDDAELGEHLESCPACRARHVGLELACDVMLASPLPEFLRRDPAVRSGLPGAVGDGLARRVLAELAMKPKVLSGQRGRALDAPGPLRRRRAMTLLAAIPVAAATLLVLYLSGADAPGLRPQPAAGRMPVAASGVPAAASRVPAAANRVTTGAAVAVSSSIPSVHRAGLGSAALAHRIGVMAQGIDRVAQGAGVVALDTSQEFVTALERIPDVTIELAGEGRGDLTTASEPLWNVSHSLRPVTASVSETWQILKRAVPTGDPRRG